MVDFTGGTLNSHDVESPDPLPFDGGARVRVTDPGVTTTASALTAEGVAVHVLQADVRNAKGRVVGTRPVTASAGHWHRTVRYDVGRSQPGTYEVVDFSEQDGSLSCIAQIRVALTPAP